MYHKLLKLENLDFIIIVFSSLFIIGFFNEHITAIKNIGLYGALLFTLIKIYYFREKSLIELIETFKTNKLLIVLLVSFLLVILVSSYYAYSNNTKSMYLFYKEVKHVMIFAFSMFFIHDKSKMIKYLMYSAIIAILLLNYHFFMQSFDYDRFRFKRFQIDRHYSFFIENIFAFALVYFLIVKNFIIKNLILIFILIASVILLLLTGARAAWLNISVQIIIILMLLISYNKKVIIDNSRYILGGLLFVLVIITYSYSTSTIIKNKINQGYNSSGRDYIIESRLPIVLELNNLVLGMGYGTHNYVQFLNDHNVIKKGGKYDKKNQQYIYSHDEPYLISVFYHFGIIGLVLMLGLILKFIIDALKMKENIVAIALLSTFLGFFFVRGLFEHMHLNIVIFLILLLIILKKSISNENSIHIS